MQLLDFAILATFCIVHKNTVLTADIVIAKVVIKSPTEDKTTTRQE